mgnify:CR=1 FL=1
MKNESDSNDPKTMRKQLFIIMIIHILPMCRFKTPEG